MVNLVTNRVCRILGKVENTERFLGLALYQGIPGTGGRTKRMGAGISPAESDPMLVACAYKRQRLYLFSRREPPDTDEVAIGRCCTGSDLSVLGSHIAAGFVNWMIVAHSGSEASQFTSE